MKRVLLILLATLPITAITQVTTPSKDDNEILVAYDQMIELAKQGGYNNHKNQSGKPVDGLKTLEFVIAFGEPSELTRARLRNITVIAEKIYELNHSEDPIVAQILEYEKPRITLQEGSEVEVTASVVAPPGTMKPRGYKWTFRLKRGLDGWRIFAAKISEIPDTSSGVTPELFLRPRRDSNSRP